MSLRGLPRYHWGPSFESQNNLGQLLSLIDDIPIGQVRARPSNTKQNQDHFFSPRFDLKEAKDYYQLEGELPGIEQKNLSIEFTDEQTLVISGHSESHHEEGTPPKQIEGTKDSSHKARVDDEGADGESSEVVKSSSGEKKKPEYTYWVSERAWGQFTRSFCFPARVNQNDVTAKLENGILTIRVHKATEEKSRKKIHIG